METQNAVSNSLQRSASVPVVALREKQQARGNDTLSGGEKKVFRRSTTLNSTLDERFVGKQRTVSRLSSGGLLRSHRRKTRNHGQLERAASCELSDGVSSDENSSRTPTIACPSKTAGGKIASGKYSSSSLVDIIDSLWKGTMDNQVEISSEKTDSFVDGAEDREEIIHGIESNAGLVADRLDCENINSCLQDFEGENDEETCLKVEHHHVELNENEGIKTEQICTESPRAKINISHNRRSSLPVDIYKYRRDNSDLEIGHESTVGESSNVSTERTHYSSDTENPLAAKTLSRVRRHSSPAKLEETVEKALKNESNGPKKEDATSIKDQESSSEAKGLTDTEESQWKNITECQDSSSQNTGDVLEENINSEGNLTREDDSVNMARRDAELGMSYEVEVTQSDGHSKNIHPNDSVSIGNSDLLTEVNAKPRVRSKSLPVVFSLDHSEEDETAEMDGDDTFLPKRRAKSLPDVFKIEVSPDDHLECNQNENENGITEGKSAADHETLEEDISREKQRQKTERKRQIGRSKSLPCYDFESLDSLARICVGKAVEDVVKSKRNGRNREKLQRSHSLPTILEGVPFFNMGEEDQSQNMHLGLEGLAVIKEDVHLEVPSILVSQFGIEKVVTKDIDIADNGNTDSSNGPATSSEDAAVLPQNNGDKTRVSGLENDSGDSNVATDSLDHLTSDTDGPDSEGPERDDKICANSQVQEIPRDCTDVADTDELLHVDDVQTQGQTDIPEEDNVIERLKMMGDVEWDVPIQPLRPRGNTLPLTEYLERIPELPEKDSPDWETKMKGVAYAFTHAGFSKPDADLPKRKRSWPQDYREARIHPVELLSKEVLLGAQKQLQQMAGELENKLIEGSHEPDGARMLIDDLDRDALRAECSAHAASYPDSLDLQLMRKKPGHDFEMTHHLEKLEELEEALEPVNDTEQERDINETCKLENAGLGEMELTSETEKTSDSDIESISDYEKRVKVFDEKLTAVINSYLEPDFSQSASSIHRAVAADSVERLIALINSGADVNAPDEHGRPPLHVAVISGHVECAECLIRAGADLEGYTKALINEYRTLNDEVYHCNY